MNTQRSYYLVVLCLLLVALAELLTGCNRQSDESSQAVFGGNYHLDKGQTLAGDLVIFGGEAVVQEGAIVTGDVVLFGGTLSLSGEVKRNVLSFGGALTLKDTAVVQGDVATMGGNLSRAEKARIVGNIVTGVSQQMMNYSPHLPYLPFWAQFLDPLRDIFWGILQSVAISAIAVILALLAPKPLDTARQVVAANTLSSGLIGLLTILVAPALFLVMIITIVLIPVSILGFILLFLAGTFGWIVLGFEIGRKMFASQSGKISPAVEAGLGTLILSLTAGLTGMIPCVGWLAPFIAMVIGMGGVLLSRFGTTLYQIVPAPSVSINPPPSSFD